MKYVPNLIPDESKVDISSIVNEDSQVISENEDIFLISKFLGIVLYIVSIFIIFRRFWEGLLFVFLATVILPKGKDFLERTLKFKFTNQIRIKTIVTSAVLIIFSILYYNKLEDDRAIAEKIEEEKKIEQARLKQIEDEKIEKARKEKIDSDKLNAEAMFKIGNLEKGLVFLNSAIDSAVSERNELIHKRASVNYNFRKYESALDDYNILTSQNYNSGITYYERALCLIKLSKTKEAIEDIKKSIQLGNKEAEKLYESVNPLRRKIVSYVTRCCNGSTSGAKGRGACSRNGGVCNWQEPVYQEYREY